MDAPLGVGHVDGAEQWREANGERREHEAHGSGGEQGTEDDGQGFESGRGHSSGRPGTGKREQMS